ncbi:response regulator transcription factor [Halobacillus karajensis]|uniref:Staphylococcal respiratory response protein A n=1 Tax=Halobacillus karajensis TaxID=195088 RepID=A0A059NZ91_9BACI|nr:response regulator transcription factor [Halobacillus karajensis]CDQ18511.1 Staphylococcal respiratory response protein A [Halobacillus karajensis]CDQ23417.1 Staphylococcal respiratory response protein A [Halobacillus karajensis]CDQ26899.1 Staphylococcal respiratory response protein A [Halobacillus karajensis]
MTASINILVVEDDNDINRLLCNIIKENGYTPKPAYSGTEATIYLDQQKWDMVVLDLMLPGLTGEEVLTKLNEERHTPVIIISAKQETQTKVDTLRAGADDYITKPFDVEEVSARIDSCLRRYQRMDIQESSEFRYKNLVLDTDLKKIHIHNKELRLTAREYKILVLLLTSPKKVFSKANLFEAVWNEKYYGDDNTINVHMSNLRSKLSTADPSEEYIETVWGMGYKLKT